MAHTQTLLSVIELLEQGNVGEWLPEEEKDKNLMDIAVAIIVVIVKIIIHYFVEKWIIARIVEQICVGRRNNKDEKLRNI